MTPMIYTFLLLYGWIIALLCGLGWIYAEHRLKRVLRREDEYLRMIAAHNLELRPSLAALKTAKRTALIVMLLLMPSLSHAQTVPIVIGNLADLVSTEIVIAQGHAREANPIMGSSTLQRVAVKAAGTAVQVWLVKQLEPRHPRMAKVIGYSVGGSMSLLAVHNLRSVRR